MMGTCSKRRTLRVLHAGGVSLVIVSIVVPGLSKVHTAFRTHGADDVPVVVLSTGARSTSGVLKLGIKTSSCIAGPFGPLRLITHIGSRLQHCAALSDAPSNSTICRTNNLIVGSRLGGIAMSKRRIGLAPVRCGVLLLLVGGGKGMFSVDRVCRRV